uniref:Uncharacterized protein n=1 Tax=Chromera velia CCMP2878 TaxID=1169474 RepID=A0A0G4H5N8_9ALVE|eukprot:Cvel_24744.t1-p1 / transcript=Cvel_24744.t1 / gene=Cvel_24744 / organism=Chromera_velia_CCMP2878 / gene_product=hypothetical protein / transcript_product=hypothetical protein / location=Cvel_scaffold2718:1106-5670(+) / protein_length=199 / sequence_SO=supercontig / SO=protein_coding / is_pseudo=false
MIVPVFTFSEPQHVHWLPGVSLKVSVRSLGVLKASENGESGLALEISASSPTAPSLSFSCVTLLSGKGDARFLSCDSLATDAALLSQKNEGAAALTLALFHENLLKFFCLFEIVSFDEVQADETATREEESLDRASSGSSSLFRQQNRLPPLISSRVAAQMSSSCPRLWREEMRLSDETANQKAEEFRLKLMQANFENF